MPSNKEKKSYVGRDGGIYVNLYCPNFPEALYLEVAQYAQAYQVGKGDIRSGLIHLLEKGLGKR